MDLSLIKQAQSSLASITVVTPLTKVNFFEEYNLFLKLENLQTTGAYKLRGATFKIANLSDDEKSRGVIAASAGNHAQGVANASARLGIDAIIVMPKTAPLSKVEATAKYGVKIIQEGITFDDAYRYAKQLQEDTGRVFIEPFNDEDIIAGQGTIALEILEKLCCVDTIVVPVGGGGLISGIAFTAKQINPSIKIVGVQTTHFDSMVQSVADKNILTVSKGLSTLADGIAVKTPGSITYEYCSKYVDEWVTVEEDEIASAVLTLIEKQKCVAEGAGAAAFAACMYNKFAPSGNNVVAIVSGGNIDVTLLSRIIDAGLLKSGRKTTLGITLADKPGQLGQLLTLIGRFNANVCNIDHHRASHEVKAGYAYTEVEIETTSFSHIDEIVEQLQIYNYKVQIIK